ncbi:MAG: DUF2938 family protein [Gemmatimonadota bacterium]|jgi:hypothetical protein
MDLVIAAVVAGVVGTAVMDLGNLLFARLGVISRVDLRILGRMARGWARGRFRYADPSEMEKIRHEAVYGAATHYCIGVGLAASYLLGWELLVGGRASPAFAVIYGIATTAASWFLVYPSMGFGVLGLRSPEGWKAALSSLSNHLFYGLGLAAGVVLV